MEKKKLRRRCDGCARILDVDKMDGAWSDKVWENTVRWATDSFLAEIHEEYIWMWLCGKCEDDRRDEI